jgi:hypothetical protein
MLHTLSTQVLVRDKDSREKAKAASLAMMHKAIILPLSMLCAI